MKVDALIVPEPGTCDVETQELDERLEPDQVLLRTVASVISAGTELSVFMKTHRGFDSGNIPFASYPYYPGYSAVGEVVDIGRDVGTVRKGDMVRFSGKHATCSKAKASTVAPLPAGMDPQVAAFHSIVGHAMTGPRLAPPRFGENVVVVGLGLIGILTSQLFRLAGAGVVAGADLSEFRLRKAREVGAIDAAFNVRERSLTEWVGDLEPYGAELIVDAVGAERSVDSSFKAVAEHGRVLLLGCSRNTMPFDPYMDIHWKGVTVIGGHSKNVDPAIRGRDRDFIISLLAAERVRVRELITHRVPYAEAQSAYEGLRDKTEEYLGVVITYE